MTLGLSARIATKLSEKLGGGPLLSQVTNCKGTEGAGLGLRENGRAEIINKRSGFGAVPSRS